MNVKFCDSTKEPICSCFVHAHKYWEIILYTSGHVYSSVDGKEYYMEAGDVFVIPPGISHGENSDMPYTDLYIQCESLDFGGTKILHDFDGALLPLMNLLLKTYIQKDASYTIVADSLLHSISSYLHKYDNENCKYEFVNALKNEMVAHLSDEKFHVPDFARKSGYNIDYLRRCFKAETGKTPLAYLIDMRLNHAKALLEQETYVSIAAIAEKCGFSDSFYFSKLFKQHFGVSPLQYRLHRR